MTSLEVYDPSLDHAYDLLQDPDRLGREVLQLTNRIRAADDHDGTIETAISELVGLIGDLVDALRLRARQQ